MRLPHRDAGTPPPERRQEALSLLPGAAVFARIGGLENGIYPHPPVFFVRISIHGSC